MKRFARFFNQHGFTLIELLIVIVILAILMAVAAPSFLGQTQKAQDSVAKQNLTLSWKAARSEAASNAAGGGKYPSQAILAGTTGSPGGAIQSDEPALTITPATSTDDGYTSASSAIKPSHIFVFSNVDNYTAYNHSDSGKVFCITGDYSGQQAINSGSGCPGGDTLSAGTPAITPGSPEIFTTAHGENGSGWSPGLAYTYQWSVGDSTTGPWTEINGATSQTLDVNEPTWTTRWLRYCVTGTTGVKHITKCATAQVADPPYTIGGTSGNGGSSDSDLSAGNPSITGTMVIYTDATGHEGSGWSTGADFTLTRTWYYGTYEGGSWTWYQNVEGNTLNLGLVGWWVAYCVKDTHNISGSPWVRACTTAGPIIGSPVNISAPVLGGMIHTNDLGWVPVVNSPLTVSSGDWQPGARKPESYTYQWYKFRHTWDYPGTPIDGATESSYTPTLGETDYFFLAYVTAHNVAGSVTVISNASGNTIDPKPQNITPPSGAGDVGTWRTDPSVYTPDPNGFTTEVFRCSGSDECISGSVGSPGHWYHKVLVTATNSYGSTQVFSPLYGNGLPD